MLKNLTLWARRHIEHTVLIILGIAIGLIWALAELTDEVFEGSTTDLDRDILLFLRTPGDLTNPIGPLWLEEVGRDLTALGGIAVLTIMTVVVGLYFALSRRFTTAVYLWAAVSTGILVSTFAKLYFDRARPDLVPHGSIVQTASFPSGHSMMAAVCYLTLGVLLAQAQDTLRLKIYVLSVAIFITLLVGVSRVYLGVHWPTDVAAGWLAGAFWALLCVLVSKAFAHRHEFNHETEERTAP